MIEITGHNNLDNCRFVKTDVFCNPFLDKVAKSSRHYLGTGKSIADIQLTLYP